MSSYGSVNENSPLTRRGGKGNHSHGHGHGGILNKHTAQDGTLKAAVFGFSDGLCTNVNVILGMYAGLSGANSAGLGLASQMRHILTLTGLCGMLGGASSMACGEWLSASAEAEANKTELEKERWHHRVIPDVESSDMRDMMLEAGLSEGTVDSLSVDLDKMDIEQRISFHARFELGIEEEELSVLATIKNAAFMWISFAVGGVIPLMPWLCGSATASPDALFMWTLVATVLAMFLTSVLQVRGAGVGVVSKVMARTFGRQLIVVALAVGLTIGLNLALLGSVGGSS